MIGTSKQIIHSLKNVFPILKPTNRKGENGRIAVIGGSIEFTGAPFYSAISSLKVGADLAHIFCSKSASPAIKSYSPEVIVHPVFTSEAEIKLNEQQLKIVHGEWLEKILAWKPAIHSWIVGPGLGRDKYMTSFFPLLIRNLPQGCILIIDADGIYFLSQYPELLDQLKRYRTILTPNARQLLFLKKIIGIDAQNILEKYKGTEEITELPAMEEFKGFTVFVKGQQDLILSSKKSYIIRTQGGLKRCGGLGDILSGVLGTCSYWNFDLGLVLASRIVRIATRLAYQEQGRGLTAPTVIKQLTKVVHRIESSL